MKRKLFFLLNLLTLTILATSQKALADHFAAGDLTATYIGPGLDGCTGTTTYIYLVTFDEYKPCDPGNADLPKNETAYYQSANAGVGPVAINFTNPEIDTLDQLCDVFKSTNRCHIPDVKQPLGFVRHRFSTTVTLPSAQSDWVFSWASCCTTTPLLNVVGFQPIYIEIGINNLAKYNASTPQYLAEPLPYLCVNQPATFLNSPYDPNNDSLYTYAIQHYLAAGSQLAFQPGYSLANPLQASAANPYTVNPATGAATFTPTLQGRFNLAFQTDEYDRKTGVRVAYARRDVEVNVLPCNAPPPTVDSVPVATAVIGGKVVNLNGSTTQKTIVTCPGNNVQFSINSKARTATSKIYMSAETGNMPGYTFNVTGAGGQDVTGTLGWTPTNIGQYSVTITSKDSTCDGVGSLIVLKSVTVILIDVVGGLDAGRDQMSCELDPPTRRLSVRGFGDIPLSVKWTDISGGPAIGIDYDTSYTPIVRAPGGAQFVVYSPDLIGQCKSRDTVALYNDTSNTIDIFPQTDKFVMCRPGYLQLDVVTNGDGPVDNVKCDTIPDYSKITRRDSVTIWGSPVYGVGYPIDTIGTETPRLESEYTSNKYQFIIPQSELREYGLRSGSIKGLSFDITSNKIPAFQYGDFSIFMKCTNKTELSKSSGFETGMVQVYKSAAPITLEDGVHTFEFDKPYNWDTTKSLVIGICYANNPAIAAPCTSISTDFPGLFKYMPTTYVSALDYKEDPTTADVCGTSTPNGGYKISEKFARPVMGLKFYDVPGKPFRFNWYPGTLLSDSTIR
ncbi:MAG: hypothetical protein ACTHKV_01910, partial [Flavipsychrobacter sp.]